MVEISQVQKLELYKNQYQLYMQLKHYMKEEEEYESGEQDEK